MPKTTNRTRRNTAEPIVELEGAPSEEANAEATPDPSTDMSDAVPVVETPAPVPTATKLSTVVSMLRSEKGATVAEIMAATNWQAHSVRGFLSGTVKKKLGMTLLKSSAADGTLTYTIASQEQTMEATAPESESSEASQNAHEVSDAARQPAADLGAE